MPYDLLLRKRGVCRIIVGVPEGEAASIRARLETGNGDVITLAEATLSALVQAYMDVFTHPSRQAIELRADAPGDDDHPQTVPRLTEVTAEEDALRRELASGPPAQIEAADGDDDDTAAIAHPQQSESKKDFTGPLSIDDGPVFGDIATQHSRPAPIDPDPSVDEAAPGPSDSDSGTDDA